MRALFLVLCLAFPSAAYEYKGSDFYVLAGPELTVRQAQDAVQAARAAAEGRLRTILPENASALLLAPYGAEDLELPEEVVREAADGHYWALMMAVRRKQRFWLRAWVALKSERERLEEALERSMKAVLPDDDRYLGREMSVATVERTDLKRAEDAARAIFDDAQADEDALGSVLLGHQPAVEAMLVRKLERFEALKPKSGGLIVFF